MRLLLIDNYDSFVYNLAQAFGSLGEEIVVVRNDSSLTELTALEPDAVVVSPGPGTPEAAGVSVEAVRAFSSIDVPVFGVCLGHQCIGIAFGASVSRAAVGPVHGKTSIIDHDGRGVFAGLPTGFAATRYHSLAIDEEPVLPNTLRVTARSSDGVVMGVRHASLAVEGVQFHPESVLTHDGISLLQNFISFCRSRTPS
ncbi:MAG: anthranilate synthase component II [Actinomycetota bacterium]